MKNNFIFELFVTLVLILQLSFAIYVPENGQNLKPITYTSGIKTTLYRKPEVQIHHNYSRIFHQNQNEYRQSYPDDDGTSQRPYPVFNAHTYGQRQLPSEAQTQVYVLNGTRIRKNENPTRQIVIYNKQKRTPKVEIYKACPKNATGQFVYEASCNQFLNCWRGRGYVQNCAPGTLFNPKTLECDYPEKVYCISGPRQSILQRERSAKSPRQVGCPKEFTGLIPNYTDCSKFINCVSGIENFMDCPPGTLFDINKNICDFPSRVTCFNGENQKYSHQEINTKLDFGRSASARYTQRELSYRHNEIKCPYGVDGLYPHATDCSKFLNCANGQTYIQDCSPGTLFNPTLKICDFPYNVRCNNTSNFGVGVIDYDAGYYGRNGSRLQTYGSTGEQEVSRDKWGRGYNQASNTYGTYAGQYDRNQGSWTGDSSTRQQTEIYDPHAGYNTNQGTVPGQNYGSSYYNRGSNNQGTSYYGSTNQYETNGGSYYEATTLPYENNYYSRPISQSNYYGSSTDRYNEGSGYQETGYANTQNQFTRGTVNQDSGSYGTSFGSHRPDTYHQVSGQGSINQDSGLYETSGSYRPNQYYGGQNRQDTTIYEDSTNRYGPVDNEWGSNRGNSYGTTSNNRKQSQYGSGYNRNQYGQTTHNTRDHYKGSGSGYNQNSWSGTNAYSSNQDNAYNQRSDSDWVPTMIDQRPETYNTYNSQNQNGRKRDGQPHPTYNTNYRGTNRDDSYHRDTITTQHNRDGSYYGRSTTQTQYNQPWYQQNQNDLDDDNVTPNYDQVVNINQVRKTSRIPFRSSYEPFFGPTTTHRTRSSSSQSKVNDYDDTFGTGVSNKYTRATTPNIVEKHWPPPFPSTDVNADYVFEDVDDRVTLEAENSVKNDRDGDCGKSAFRCSATKCIPKTLVCNSVKDCPDGTDEIDCLDFISKFSIEKNHKLAVLEKERWDNISIATCALLCVQSKEIRCRSFNYRKIDKTCFLTNTNEALTGALISYYPFDYYELISEKINCSGMHICSNKKCISKHKICDGLDDCGDRMDEKGCKPEDFGYRVRLTGSREKNEGQIEVTAFGKTGYVCDDKFGLRDANVVCKELGFYMGAAEVRGNSFYSKNETDKPFYMMDDVTCVGNETRLMDCDFSGWGVHNCLGQEIVGVVCKTPQEKCADDYWQCDTGQECLPLAFVCDGLLDCTDGSDEGSQHCDAPTEIRLVNGSTHQEGRLEIRHHGIWGTVCDDDFNEDAAKVVCKHLGYKGSAIVKKDGYFGAGSGPIWLDQVFCSGNETSIEKCTHWNWGEHNCEHSEDVGVICSNYHGHERHSALIPMPAIPPVYPDRCGYRKDNIFNRNDDVHFRVVRGSVAQRGDYPWQAAIRVKGKSNAAHWCGAVIISEKFVLTAAHCLIGYSKGAYIVVAGDYNVDEDEGTEQEAYIEDFYLHQDFRKGHKMNNDIALVKLKGRGFRLNQDVQAICLPDSDTIYEAGLNCTISGYGSIESGKSAFSHNLRAGWVPLQKREICTMPHVYGDAITDGMICAGSLDEGIDSCDGDSGGPLACLYDGVFTLFGITSWGQHCGYANKPGVYVKVAHYKKWIDENFHKHSLN